MSNNNMLKNNHRMFNYLLKKLKKLKEKLEKIIMPKMVVDNKEENILFHLKNKNKSKLKLEQISRRMEAKVKNTN